MKFSLGRTVITRGALDVLTTLDIIEGLHRHSNGDWGDVCDEDKLSNDRALDAGDRLLSSYQAASRVEYWVITEWDRSVTTILLPEEY